MLELIGWACFIYMIYVVSESLEYKCQKKKEEKENIDVNNSNVIKKLEEKIDCLENKIYGD